DAGALHGDMDQRARMAMLAAFRDGKLKLLVASDVAARGLDIPDVSHVFNYDVPIHAEDYVHRIGRTGRAGRSGKSFTIVSRSDTKYLDSIERLIGNKIDWLNGDLSTLGEDDADDERPRRGKGRERGRATEDRKPRGGKRTRKEEPAPAEVEEVVLEAIEIPVEPAPSRRENIKAENAGRKGRPEQRSQPLTRDERRARYSH